MNTINVAEKKITLEEVLAQLWAMLARGVNESNDPFRTPVLGTAGPTTYGPLYFVKLESLHAS